MSDRSPWLERPTEAHEATTAWQHALTSLAHPVSVGAVVVLLLNDHVFKRRWPGSFTGKLSDVAGLVFFPLLLGVLLALVARRRLPLVAALTTAAWFALIKTVPAATRATETLD